MRQLKCINKWCLPLNILLATAPQGAIGSPLSVINGMQYVLGF